MRRICFVCLGNICRSPLAEGVFQHLAQQAGRADEFVVESAGLGGWHVGEAPDSRARQVAQAHRVSLTSRARQFLPEDFDRFDLVLALDQSIFTGLHALAPDAARARKIDWLCAADPATPSAHDVPDPYYGTTADFEYAYTLIERACAQWLARLAAE